MAAFLAKLFPGSSSSAPAVPEVNSMEALCKAINDLSTESHESAGAKAAELTRKNREIFERKTADIEAFLLHCSPKVGSAAMVAAIAALFDTSYAKTYETGSDRAVELLKHYIDGGQLDPVHLRMVSEIVFPLVRNVAYYCLEKKNKPAIGEEIVISALKQLLPGDAQYKLITSCHAALFSCAVRTRHFDLVAPYIDEFVEGVYNESGRFDCSDELAKSPSTSTSASSDSVAMNLTQDYLLVPLVASSSSTNQNAAPMVAVTAAKQFKPKPTPSVSMNCVPKIEAKYFVQYLYYGALILIERGEYKRALILLETCVSLPTTYSNEFQMDAYKKYFLVSLLLHGSAKELTDKSAAVVRLTKSRMGDYKSLLSIKFARGKNTHGELEKWVCMNKKQLEKDDNLTLTRKIIAEMKFKAVLAVVRIYSSIHISDIKHLVNFIDDKQTLCIIEELVLSERIDADIDTAKNTVVWSERVRTVSTEDVLKAIELTQSLSSILEDKNNWLKAHPSILSRSIRGAMLYNDDEGLSMGNNPLDV